MAAAAYSLSQHSSRQRRRMLHHRVPLSHATDKKPQPPIDFTQHQRFFSFTPSQVAVSSNAGLLASFQKRACMHKLLAEEPYMSSMSASIAVQPFSGITALSIAEPLSCSVPARATTRFCAFSVAELSAESPTTTHSSTAAAPTATSLDIYIEKGLGDAFRPFNITLSTVLALSSAMAMEAVRSGNLPVDAGDGELDEAEPMDWWLVGSNFSLALARDLSGSTCQRGGEKLLKRRVPPGLHAEMIKSVPKMARKSYLSEVAAGRTPFGARTATAKLVIRSPVYYLSSALPRLVTDMAVDVLRIFFPKHWRSRLTVPSFYRNARLKLIKYALQAVCSLCVGSLVPLVWPHTYMFIVSDLIAAQAAEITVNSCFGQVE